MKIRHSALGFTLMELILVIVLLSIVALSASSRFIGKGSFSAYAVQDQAISVIRQVQLNRMQSNVDVNKNYPERCDPNDYAINENNSYLNFCLLVEDTCIGSVAACALTGDERDSRSDFVADDSAKFSLSTGVKGRIDFDLLGNPLNSASGGVVIIIQDQNGDSRCEVEINSQGYVSKGACS